jgi:hypothetical protein
MKLVSNGNTYVLCVCVCVCMSMYRVFHLEQSLLIYLSNLIVCTLTNCIIQGIFLCWNCLL